MKTSKLTTFLIALTLLLLISACSASVPSPNATPATTPVPTESPAATPDVESDLPKFLLDLAKQGKTRNMDFAAGTATIAQIEAKWGKPDKTDAAGYGIYATFGGHEAAFGYNKGDGLVFDVRSYDSAIRKLTLQSIKASLGEPANRTESGSDAIYSYETGSKSVLKFVIPKGQDTVDHVSVFAQASVKPDNGYFLPIVGKSNQLSEKAWANMQTWRTKMLAFAKSHPNDVILNGPNEKKVALTFDDGPDDKTTISILDTLAKYKIKGSFFFVGKNVNQFPDVVKRAYDEGHLVLSHSFSHDDLTTKKAADIHADLKQTEDAIAKVIGRKPAILRTPYGETDEKVVKAAKEDGYHIVLWSIDTLDWSQKERDNIVKNVITNVRNGDIILMHSSKEQAVSAEALPVIIEQLHNKGFEIVDLQSMLGIKAYK